MTVSRELYVNMNKAYNELFDSWKQIVDIDRDLDQTMNMAMVMLDQALDEIKKAAPPKNTSAASVAPKKGKVEIPEGWSVI